VPDRPFLFRAASVPSPSFQRPWPRVGRSLSGVMTLVALLAMLLIAVGQAWAQSDVISEINVSGNRRIPAETIKARIFVKPGDIYDSSALETSRSCGSRLPRAGA
jgi:cell division septal protein FtsQ